VTRFRESSELSENRVQNSSLSTALTAWFFATSCSGLSDSRQRLRVGFSPRTADTHVVGHQGWWSRCRPAVEGLIKTSNKSTGYDRTGRFGVGLDVPPHAHW